MVREREGGRAVAYTQAVRYRQAGRLLGKCLYHEVYIVDGGREVWA